MFEVTAVAHNWSKSFLSGRLQQTKITENGQKFVLDGELVTLGIPQGSIVGPVVFLIT